MGCQIFCSLPFQVKLIFTRRNIVFFILGMFIYQIAASLPRCFAIGLTTITSPLTNWTVVIFDFNKYNAGMFFMSMLFSFSIPTVFCFIVVLVGTIFLISNFKQSRQLRKSMSGSEGISNKMSVKDARLVRCIIFICVIYIVGSTPNVVLYVVQTVYPTLNITDLYLGNLTYGFYVVSNTFQATASSVNIFVYLGMSSKFKQTFKQIFF